MNTFRTRLLLAVGGVVVVLGAVVALVWPDDDGDRTDLQADGTTSSTSSDPTTTTTGSTSTSTTAAPTTDTSAGGSGTTAAPGTTAPAPPPPPAPDPFVSARVVLTRVVTLDYPVAMAVRPSDGSLWVARKGGSVCRLTGSSCMQSQGVASVSTGNEQGLLGLAFSAGGSRLYVSYTDPGGTSRLDSLAIDSGGTIVGGSRQNLLTQAQPEANHNGGNIAFGPDGRLYLGLGDGGGAGDQHGSTGNGQNPGTNLGKVLRIDPSTGSVQRWISGVRNPWRFSFDRATGDLWIGDVGQNRWEEVTRLPAGAQQGRNLGWRCFEGTHPFGAGCSPAGGHTPPLFEYAHGPGCSVTGGYVYRGRRIPALAGAYLYADYCDGQVRGVSLQGGAVRTSRGLGVDPGNVVSFGQDAAGELYVLTPSAIHRIDPG